MKQPLILEIKANSLDDGPGIRSVVFFKGCPLRCAWCHNPESKKIAAEISFDAKECLGSHACFDACREKALSADNPNFVDRERCTLCFECVDACPSMALGRVGSEMTVEEILAQVVKDKSFFDNSGGGVTLSGGEPTMFMEFFASLLRALKESGIQTLLETCGYFNFEKFQTLALPHLDKIYFDLKLLDDRSHQQRCGKSNSLILENFTKLHALLRDSDVELLPRVPLVPNITDTESNMLALATFLSGLGVSRAALLSYNPLWHAKTAKIGDANPCEDDAAMKTWIDKAREDRCRQIFLEAGIEVAN